MAFIIGTVILKARDISRKRNLAKRKKKENCIFKNRKNWLKRDNRQKRSKLYWKTNRSYRVSKIDFD